MVVVTRVAVVQSVISGDSGAICYMVVTRDGDSGNNGGSNDDDDKVVLLVAVAEAMVQWQHGDDGSIKIMWLSSINVIFDTATLRQCQ